MFDIQKFHSHRKGDFGKRFIYFDEIDSTNRAASDLARSGVAEGTVVLADSQTQGRGRNTHTWYSPGGVNLYFTVVLIPPVERLHYLPYVAGLSIARALDPWEFDSDLKWPNDILINGKKAGGVLIQTSLEENRLQFALVGIGINVNTRDFPDELRPIAISLAQALGKELEREKFLADLLFELEQLYGRITGMSWEEVKNLVGRRSSMLHDCPVQIEHQGEIKMGITAGLDSMGGLIVQTPAGTEIFYAGEIVSCRKK
ncbi:biotin--[acetyl-CoA-carboxylase] ligase [bacterium]|nr:biotin--[acetyl-CoA-carboxylase] ligase [bacterium]